MISSIPGGRRSPRAVQSLTPLDLLELYVQAGLTPEGALATATINPAKVFKLEKQTGSVAKGKLAELALIDGDPSKNIGDLRQVELVMRDGKLMKAQDLRAAVGISGPPKR
jgi:imidazolonepropionase-like amidohydrolase